ncbi:MULTISPECIES: HEPN domain-containing protein [unclassified Pseudomonas]|uniref:HEPN domain-containing protein n=1 Tax=unclassified Pseudomonas TaxID=196821 RepID=UPI001B33CE42|nr:MULTISPECIES: HEPN domain-containing protein [unclassified Pseudomonas]MBP5948277.1 hypothetical protein [Pseudomonas sp. P9(2020)]MBZ9560640.1 hypothetical protein [Pseudomonas sp. P116]
MDRWGVLGEVLKFEIENYGDTLISEIPAQFGGGTHVSVQPNLLDAVQQLPEMKEFSDSFIYTGNGRFSLQSRLVGEALIRLGVKYGVDAALKGLSSFLATGHTISSEIIILGGITVQERTAIGHGLFLCPPEDVPVDEFQKQYSQAKRHSPSIPLGKFDLSEKKIAGAALIRPNAKHSRFVTHSSTAQPGPDALLAMTAVQLLTLIGPSSPIVYRHFFELDDGEFLKGSSPEGYGWANEETRVSHNVQVGLPDFDGFEELVLKFISLTEKDRTHLAVSLHRLNEAVRHRSEVDKALDLGIALESLLLSGKKEKEQLSLQFRLRGAWLLGQNGSHRTELYRQFQELYDLRSMAAHTGTVSLKKGSVSDVLSNGQRLCADAIKRIIENGGYPDWGALVVGADYIVESEG